MKKIKIMILVDIFFASMGGAERQILELSRKIDQKKFELSVGCLFQKDKFLECLEKEGIKTYKFRLKRIYDIAGIRQGIRFKNMLKEQKIDILMTYHFGSDIWGTIFGKSAGVPTIISNRRDAGFWRTKSHIAAYRFVKRWVDKIVVVCQATKEMVVREEGIPADKVQVIYNGIDLNRFSEFRSKTEIKKKLNIPHDSEVCACVGNLKPVKGHIYYIEAAVLILKNSPKTHFLLIGWDEGILEQGFKSKVRTLGIQEHFHFLGSRNDVPDLLNMADICILSSLSEGASNAILEYMAAAKPVIATGVGGNPEIVVNQETGIIVNAKDAKGLAEAVISLLTDASLRNRMGKNGRSRVEKEFCINTMVRRYQKFFELSVHKDGIQDELGIQLA